MVIAPGTLLNILHNVPLDTSYDHTLYFATKDAQYAYFNSLAKYRAVNYTYVRYNDGIIRVGYKADELYDCNYIMFQNTNFGNKWFYAYIKSVNYVSNDVSEITFEIDVIQTWLFDFQPDFCFVERTHPVTDAIGDHIEPENISTGEYVMNTYQQIFDATNLGVIVAVTDVNEGTEGYTYDGIYSGSKLWGILNTASAKEKINDFINYYQQRPEAITSIYMCPYVLFPDPKPGVDTGGQLAASSSPYEETQTRGKANTRANIDGYVPKNNKLYTYPYCFYHVDNGAGRSLNLRYEFFDDKTVTLKFTGTITQPVQVVVMPVNYKGSSAIINENTLNSESLSISGFPICSWNYDTYAAWVAQNSVPLAVESGLQYAGAIGQAISMNIGGAIQSAAQTTANLYVQDYKASIAADTSKGSINNGSVLSAGGMNSFYGGKCTIKSDYARMIDDYFSKYGYSIKRLMKPIYNARPHWTYIKTIGCTVTGSVPCDDMKSICDLFDRGITFWMNGSEVGNYALDNRPIGG